MPRDMDVYVCPKCGGSKSADALVCRACYRIAIVGSYGYDKAKRYRENLKRRIKQAEQPAPEPPPQSEPISDLPPIAGDGLPTPDGPRGKVMRIGNKLTSAEIFAKVATEPRFGDETSATHFLPIEPPAEATGRPWHTYDRGIGFEIHAGDGCGPSRGPECRVINSSWRETFTKEDAELIVNSVNAHEASRRLAEAQIQHHRCGLDGCSCCHCTRCELARQVLAVGSGK